MLKSMNAPFTWFPLITAIGLGLLNPTSAMTNQNLLEERLISPAVYNLLEKNKANTTERRYNVIRDACANRQLAPIDCEPIIKRRDR